MKKDRGQFLATSVYVMIFLLASVGLALCLFWGWCRPILATNVDFSKAPVRIEPYTKSVDADGTKYYSFDANDIIENGKAFAFQTRHHNVYIYSDSTPIYRLEAKKTILGDTTGSLWNIVTISSLSKTVNVRLVPLYDSVKDDAPFFLTGTDAGIYRDLIMNSLTSAIAAIFDCMLGIYMILYFTVMKLRLKNHLADPLFYVGIASLLVGIWSFFETDASELLASNHTAASAISFISLMLLAYPYVIYVKTTLFKSDRYFFRVLTAYYAFNVTFCLIASFAGLADFKQTVPLTHIAIFSAIFYMIIAVFNEFMHGRRGRRTILNLVGFGIVGFCGSFDMILYNINGQLHADRISRTGFTVYLIIAAFISMSDLASSIEEGRKAEYYRHQALTDSLTGIGSRQAYTEAADRLKNGEVFSVVSMDLNGLKQVNDHFGHLEGDKYIRAAADLITLTFASHGECYRTGGDEFAVILTGNNAYKGASLVNELEEKAAAYDRRKDKPTKGHLTIASGVAAFTSGTDKNFDDVARRADEYMYAMKREMKAER